MNGFFTPDEVMATLGIKRTTYFGLKKQRLLGYSRLYKGGPVIHTQEHMDRYREYLNTLGQVSAGVNVELKAAPERKPGAVAIAGRDVAPMRSQRSG